MSGYDPRYYFKDRDPQRNQPAIAPSTSAAQSQAMNVPPPTTPSTARSKASKFTLSRFVSRMHLHRKKDDQRGGQGEIQGQRGLTDVVDHGGTARDADFLGRMFEGNIVRNRMDDQRAIFPDPAARARRKQKVYQPKKRVKKDEEGDITYSCEIQSENFSRRESQCRSIVRMQGGTILEDRTYPGGFLFTLPSNYIGPLPFDFDDATQVTVTRYLPPPPEALSDDSSEEPTIHTAQAMTISTPTKADMSRPDQLIEANDPASYSPSHSHSREQSAASADHDNDFIVNLARIADRDDDHASKIWPRPRDSGEITRSANWVKERAAQYQSDLMREAEQGAGLEVSEFHLTDEVGGMYLDGFTPLADWMAAGCKLGADNTIRGN